MKTIEVTRDFNYRAHPRRTIAFQAGHTYTRVIERAAQAIESAGAGRIIAPDAVGNYPTRDASHAWRLSKRK